MVEAFQASFALPVRTLRPFNTFGPRQSSRAVIPTIITQLLSGRGVRLGHLHPTRDFTYVSDTVEAFVRMAEAPGPVDGVVHVGSGREVSVEELAHTIARLMDRPLNLLSDADRQRPDRSEVDRLCADATRARTVLGWSPRRTFEEGLKETIEWLSRNEHRYRAEVYGV
jgi:nucleoside-diphosphate-sugar epimerase